MEIKYNRNTATFYHWIRTEEKWVEEKYSDWFRVLLYEPMRERGFIPIAGTEEIVEEQRFFKDGKELLHLRLEVDGKFFGVQEAKRADYITKEGVVSWSTNPSKS